MSGDRDLLERATRALREATPPTHDELAASRARLLTAHRAATKSSRARTLRWVLPLAAMLAAGTALAATPEAFERIARAVSSLLAPETRLASSRPKRPAPASHVASPVAGEPAIGPRPTPEPPPAAVPAPTDALSTRAPEVSPPTVATGLLPGEHASSSARRVARRQSRAQAEAVAPAQAVAAPAVLPSEPEPEPMPEPALDGDLASYREAHRVHFRVRDFGAALRDWDAYLAAYPSGTFAVEARYNRAICLVRLGRKADATKALTPFAEGDVAHGYRQAEANKLLEALE